MPIHATKMRRPRGARRRGARRDTLKVILPTGTMDDATNKTIPRVYISILIVEGRRTKRRDENLLSTITRRRRRSRARRRREAPRRRRRRRRTRPRVRTLEPGLPRVVRRLPPATLPTGSPRRPRSPLPLRFRARLRGSRVVASAVRRGRPTRPTVASSAPEETRAGRRSPAPRTRRRRAPSPFVEPRTRRRRAGARPRRSTKRRDRRRASRGGTNEGKNRREKSRSRFLPTPPPSPSGGSIAFASCEGLRRPSSSVTAWTHARTFATAARTPSLAPALFAWRSHDPSDAAAASSRSRTFAARSFSTTFRGAPFPEEAAFSRVPSSSWHSSNPSNPSASRAEVSATAAGPNARSANASASAETTCAWNMLDASALDGASAASGSFASVSADAAQSGANARRDAKTRAARAYSETARRVADVAEATAASATSGARVREAEKAEWPKDSPYDSAAFRSPSTRSRARSSAASAATRRGALHTLAPSATDRTCLSASRADDDETPGVFARGSPSPPDPSRLLAGANPTTRERTRTWRSASSAYRATRPTAKSQCPSARRSASRTSTAGGTTPPPVSSDEFEFFFGR